LYPALFQGEFVLDGAFHTEQPALDVGAERVAAKFSPAVDDAMAGDYYKHRILVKCVAHGAARMPDGIGDLLVRARLAVGNLADLLPYERLESRAVDLDGDGEFLEFPCEEAVEFADGLGVHLCGAATDFGLALGTGVGARLHAARAHGGAVAVFVGRRVETEAAKLGPFEREYPFAPHVPVVHDGKA